jgi:hypothetical protein
MAGQIGRSGRKSKAEEMGLKALLDECVTVNERRGLFNELKRLARGRGKTKLEAIKLLLAYLYGTPRQSVEVTGDESAPLQIVIKYADHRIDPTETTPSPDAGEAGS